jgi:hypothetical protein
MTKPFQDIVDPTGREMFSERFDSSGVDSGTAVGGGGSTLPTNRYCIAVCDESDNYSNAAMDASWAAFRVAWPDRPFFLLNPTYQYTGTTPVYAINNASASGGLINTGAGQLWIPGAAYSDANFDFMPVTRYGFETGTTTNATPSDWVTLTGVNLLSAGAKVGLFVDNSGSMYTSDVQISYDAFIAYCNTHSIDIITVTNSTEEWIVPFTGMAG